MIPAWMFGAINYAWLEAQALVGSKGQLKLLLCSAKLKFEHHLARGRL